MTYKTEKGYAEVYECMAKSKFMTDTLPVIRCNCKRFVEASRYVNVSMEPIIPDFEDKTCEYGTFVNIYSHSNNSQLKIQVSSSMLRDAQLCIEEELQSEECISVDTLKVAIDAMQAYLTNDNIDKILQIAEQLESIKAK